MAKLLEFYFLLQIKRQEVLLNKCKDTISKNKEKTAQLNSEKDALQKQIDEMKQEAEAMKVTSIKMTVLLI